MKGGGDAISAARAVLQTGEYDFAWNLQVEDEILLRLEKGGKGKVRITAGGNIEHIQLNSTDPWTEVDGERSSMKTKHPTPARPGGASGDGACWSTGSRWRITSTAAPASRHRNFVNNPEKFESKNTKWEFNVDKANDLLEDGGLEAGAGRHPREGRQEAEVRLPDLDQHAAPEEPGDRQAGLPEGRHRPRAEVGHRLGVLLVRCRQSGHLPELLLRHPDVHDDDDAARSGDVPAPVHRRGRSPPRRTSGRAATSRAGSTRTSTTRCLQGGAGELDPVKRAALFIKMNDLACGDHAVIPVVYRPRVQASRTQARRSHGSGWDSDFWNVQDWYKDA